MEDLNLVKTDQPGFARDSRSGAIINMDEGDYTRILNQRKAKKEMENRMSNLENDLSEIKTLLTKLVTEAGK